MLISNVLTRDCKASISNGSYVTHGVEDSRKAEFGKLSRGMYLKVNWYCRLYASMYCAHQQVSVLLFNG